MERIDQTQKDSNKMSTQDEVGSNKYWLSLEQWRNDPEFKKAAEDEFMTSPLSEDKNQGGWARREFLKLMGASMALTTFGCIRRPVQKIIPYVNRPEEIIPGFANYYSSSFVDGNEGFGLVVKTREGRPIKVEGLANHPANQGGLSARAHAHVLNLYDPDRATGPMVKKGNDFIEKKWDVLDDEIVAQLRKGKVAVLKSSSLSDTEDSLMDQFSKTFGAQIYSYDGADYSGITEAQQAAYGNKVMPRYRLEDADYILSLGADILGTYITPTDYNRQYAVRRKLNQSMNKLVVFEGLLSLTGSNADERHQVRPSEYKNVLLGLLHEIIVVGGNSSYARDEKVKKSLEAYANSSDTVKAVAHELWANKGKSLVLVGGVHAAQDKNLQIVAQFLNEVLGNDGKTIDAKNAPLKGFTGSVSQLAALKTKIENDNVTTLIIHGINPAYSVPKSFNFVDLLSKVESVIYTGDRVDETGALSSVLAPANHAMEDWGDAELISGVHSIQQPTIRPLYDTRGFQDSILTWATKAGNGELSNYSTWYEYLRAYWQNHQYAKNRGFGIAKGDFEEFWQGLLQEGVFVTSKTNLKSTSGSRAFNTTALTTAVSDLSSESISGSYELELYHTSGLREGTLANVSWLQEFPDPVTKICWDNYVTVSMKTAHDMHLEEGDFMKVTVGGESLTVPVHIQPGQEPHVLGLALGYGRTKAGKVANGVGVKASDLATFSNGKFNFAGLGAELAQVEGSTKLANMQGHHSMEGRQIVVEATLDQFKENPAANIHKHKIFSMWSEHKYAGHKWGMAIDLNSCTGCAACMIACQAENNITVVGKQYVTEGRIMHWIRLDRYYTGSPNDPGVVHMPVNCQHCENAPCESVCPVAATTHDDEGLNDMTYNRCVGTRYCANNCPYKVRRFNWFDYTGVEKPLNMAYNPEVTVRARGVMEKCTLCNNRIKQEKHLATNEGRILKDGDIQTACEQSCPTKAITFGDMNDKNSRVSIAKAEKRNYKLLEELNAVPSVSYLTKVRNTKNLKGHSGADHGQGGH
ncbi:MAG: TAT-variant-translocated molybdopterin oxidoreductase [Bdellovibrionaceae bacterium]|jgi:MoCo/4Fe-4S cofactor protein with predicted Tat translocation signal|nr:TAT-variant-translocated molybdopterin oxidoreductase [Pseudobdellovibrionaceae bacterium]